MAAYVIDIGLVESRAGAVIREVVRKRGRPPKPKQIRDLVIRIADDNLSWGYGKIRDAANVGRQIDVCRTIVANILHEAGILDT